MKIFDIIDIENEFLSLSDKKSNLSNGFLALYGHYTNFLSKNLKGDGEVFNYKEDIIYRIDAVVLHLNVLIKLQEDINTEILYLESNDPEFYTRIHFPSNPHVDHYQKQITALFDSIVFHLASAMDYFAAILNYVYHNKDKSVSKWSNLVKACRNPSKLIHNSTGGKKIVELDKVFINRLYEYRSKLIHNKSSMHHFVFASLSYNESRFVSFISDSVANQFDFLRKLMNDGKISTNFFVYWLIESTIDCIALILKQVRTDIEELLSKTNIYDFTMYYIDSRTENRRPHSDMFWVNFERNINSKYF